MRDRLDDAALVARLRVRDREAFQALVHELHGSLVRLAMMFVSSRATADEVAQDTWRSVLASLDEFQGRSSLRTWIFRVCTNRAKTLAGREARSTPLSALEDHGESPADPARSAAAPPLTWTDDTPERVLDRSQAVAELERALAAMPSMQRAVLTLRDVQGLESGQVCDVLAISESNQRVLLHRARARARRALEELV